MTGVPLELACTRSQRSKQYADLVNKQHTASLGLLGEGVDVGLPALGHRGEVVRVASDRGACARPDISTAATHWTVAVCIMLALIPGSRTAAGDCGMLLNNDGAKWVKAVLLPVASSSIAKSAVSGHGHQHECPAIVAKVNSSRIRNGVRHVHAGLEFLKLREPADQRPGHWRGLRDRGERAGGDVLHVGRVRLADGALGMLCGYVYWYLRSTTGTRGPCSERRMAGAARVCIRAACRRPAARGVAVSVVIRG